jgi:hypothetical protein
MHINIVIIRDAAKSALTSSPLHPEGAKGMLSVLACTVFFSDKAFKGEL